MAGAGSSDAAEDRADLRTVGFGGSATRPSATGRAKDDVSQPTRVGRFAILRPLGQGAMGRVYAAYDEELDRKVAIKVLRKVSPVAEERVRREAQAMARLSDPHVVQVFEVGEHDGSLFIAMEFADGQTLKRWQRQRGRTWSEVLDAYRQAAEGLAAAHAAGIIHRDFKPSNATVLSPEGGDIRVKVFDFGLALRMDRIPSGRVSRDSVDMHESLDGLKLTRTGGLVGTPAYMAPEQYEGDDVDEAVDQFALCVSLWEGLFGELPFGGDTLAERKQAALEGRIRRPASDRDVPGWLRGIVERGLRADPAERYPSMPQLVVALQRDPAARRRKLVTIATAGVLVVGGAVGLHAWQGADSERCQGGALQLQGVWDDDRRDAVRQALEATGRTYAEATASYVTDRLDRYADAWVDAFTEACAATTIRGEQSVELMDLRMACLHRGKRGLSAAVTVLAEADAKVLENATGVVNGLPALQSCSDIDALQAQHEPPSAAEADAVERIRDHLSRTVAEREAGRYDQAQSSLDAARAELGSVEYRPVHIETALATGDVLRSRGDFSGSEAAFREALREATAIDDREAMFEAAATLAFVIGWEEQRVSEAVQYRELMEGLAQSPGQQSSLQMALASLLAAQGRYAEAEAATRRALALTSESSDPEGAHALTLRKNIAMFLRQQGKYEQTEASLRQALTETERLLGPDHPEVADLHENLGVVLFEQHEDEEAEEHLRHALQIQLRALGEEHPTTYSTRNSLAGALHDQGRYAEAEVEIRKVLAGWERTLGPEHPSVGTAVYNLGEVRWLQDDAAGAEPLFRRALAIWEQSLGEDHPEVAVALVALAEVLVPDRPKQALSMAERGWTLRQREDISPKERGDAAYVLARAIWANDPSNADRERALLLARTAQDEYVAAGAAATDELREVRTWLADR